MAVFLPGVVAQLNRIGGTAIGGLSRLSLTVVGRGDSKITPLNLRSLNLLPPPVGVTPTFPSAPTFGTSVSGATPATATTSGDTLILNLNGDGAKTIILATSGSGAAVAADIQAKVRALLANSPVNQVAYDGFTAVYTTVYTLTSGTLGTGSSVVVTGGTAAAALKLGVANGGTEVAGAQTNLYYVVTAVNPSGETTVSNELSVVSQGATKVVSVGWDAVTGFGITQYNVYRSTTSGSYTNALIASVQGEKSSSYMDVGTTPSAFTPPVSNTALKVPYNTFKQYSSMTQMRSAFGSLNELGIAAQLAQSLGLNSMNAVSVDFRAVDAAVGTAAKLFAKEAAYKNALAVLLKHPTDIVVLLDPEPEISLVGKSHVVLANDPLQYQMERVLFCAGGVDDNIGDTATAGSLVYNATQSFNSPLVSAWAPVSPFMIILDDNGNASEQPLNGCYTALASAIINCIQPDEATPITNKQFSAFTRYGTNFDRADLLILDPQGVATQTIDANGVSTIVHGITTATDTFEDAELNVSLQENKLLSAVRAASKFAIGQKNTDALRLVVHDKLATVLNSRVAQGLMTDWSGLEVLQDPARPTFILVNFLHTPMFGANVILITLAFDTRNTVGS